MQLVGLSDSKQAVRHCIAYVSGVCRPSGRRGSRLTWQKRLSQVPRIPSAQQQPWRRRLRGLLQHGQQSQRGLRNHRMAAAQHQHMYQTVRQHWAPQPLAALIEAAQCLLAVRQVRALLLLAAMLFVKQAFGIMSMRVCAFYDGAPYHSWFQLPAKILLRILPKICLRFSSGRTHESKLTGRFTFEESSCHLQELQCQCLVLRR